MKSGAIFLFCIISIASAFAQNTQSKVALVIGAQNYTNVQPLQHSINDANDLSASLKTKGFQVETLIDPKTKKELKDAITRYYNATKDKKGGVGIIYYAGHGTQNEGENYLIPTTANLQIPGDLDEQCVKLNTLMSVLNSGDNLNILMLDACRTNSFPSFSRDAAAGLAPVESPKGSIVVFATQPGTVASDGLGKNGLFTDKVLKYINEPNLNVIDVFRKVKIDVYTESKNKQLPSVVDNSLGGEFYFNKIDQVKSTQLERESADGINSAIGMNEPILQRVSFDSSLMKAVEPDAKYYALLIGVSTYHDKRIPSIPSPFLNATQIYNVLVSKYSFNVGNIKLLQNPMRTDIIDTFESLSEKLTEKDNLFVFLLVMGSMIKINNLVIGYPRMQRLPLKVNGLVTP